MIFERTRDMAVVRAIMTEPRVWRGIRDDDNEDADTFQPLDSEGIHYMLVNDGAELLGCFLLVPQSAVCWDIHVCMLPAAWGPQAAAALLGMIDWIWANTTCRRIVTSVPEYNRLVLRYGREAGMRAYGRNPASYRRHGELHDLILLGISPPTA